MVTCINIRLSVKNVENLFTEIGWQRISLENIDAYVVENLKCKKMYVIDVFIYIQKIA